jgi:cytoskeletal protein RodZ
MSGKRAKPSPWRFLRLVPVALVSMVICAMVGLFLLLSGSGDDQAHDWGIDPVPSDSQDHSASGPESSSADSPDPSSPTTTTPGDPAATVQQRDASPEAQPSPETRVPQPRMRRASATMPASQPAPRVPRAPVPRPSVPATGAAKDNPGKKKGHRKGHGPHGHPDR